LSDNLSQIIDAKTQGMQEVSSKLWNDIYTNFESGTPVGIQYPTEALVKFVSTLRKNVRDPHAYFNDQGNEFSIRNHFTGRALEIGFGSIANLKMVREKGFTCYGLEVSEETVLRGCAMIQAEALNRIELSHWTPYRFPYKDDYFKLVYGLQCIYYNLKLEEVVAEVDRVLEPSGHFLFSFFSTRNDYVGLSDEVSPGVYRFSKRHPNARLHGVYFRQPESKDQLHTLFRQFENAHRSSITETVLMFLRRANTTILRSTQATDPVPRSITSGDMLSIMVSAWF